MSILIKELEMCCTDNPQRMRARVSCVCMCHTPARCKTSIKAKEIIRFKKNTNWPSCDGHAIVPGRVLGTQGDLGQDPAIDLGLVSVSCGLAMFIMSRVGLDPS